MRGIMAMKILNLLLISVLFTSFFADSVLTQSKQERRRIEKSKRLIIEGDNFFRQKNYRDAIRKYSEAIATLPTNPYAYFSKGYCHYSLGELDQAIIDLSTALEQGYRPLDVYTIRWQAYFWRKDYDLAIKDLQSALQIQPSNAYFNLALGDIYRAKQDFSNALQYYKKAAELDNQNPDVHFFIAVCHNQLGDYASQREAAMEALKRGTKYRAESWVYIGQTAQFLRKYAEAAEAYKEAIQEKSDIGKGVYFNLAEVYRLLNRFNDSIDILKRGLALYPDDGNFYVNLSWVYSLADRHEDAVAAAQRAIQMLPNEHMGYTNLCRAYNDLKQFSKAIEACNNALKIKQNDGETFFYLARAHDFLGDREQADSFYKKAVLGLVEFTKNNPAYSDGFYLLGNAYLAVNERSKAIEAYKRSIEIAPNFAKARYNLGYAYLISGNRQLAREQYEALLNIDQNLAARLLEVINKR